MISVSDLSPKAPMTTSQTHEAPWPIFRSLAFMSVRTWHYDVLAGLTLAAIAIPEQMATARLGGFPPQIGFFAFLAGSLAFAAFGSSRFLSSGAEFDHRADLRRRSRFARRRAARRNYVALASFLALLVGAHL